MKQNPQDNEAAKNSNYYATSLEKVLKKLKKELCAKIRINYWRLKANI